MSSTTVPPGIEPVKYCQIAAASKEETSWLPFQGKNYLANIIPVDEKQGKVLLAWKKEGFGKNKYNPFLSFLTDGEEHRVTIIRDLQTQSGLVAKEITKIGKIVVVLEGNPDALDVDMYRAESWDNEPSENDQIRPAWFASPTSSASTNLQPTPFDQMFEDDKYWLPLLTSGKSFIGRADFGVASEEGGVGKLLKFWFATL